ncbi:MAG TPA: hypothetical protein VEN29_02190 [Casimicrobiaceae bacterium]|nr:hypothetical protein [Casimicrobiaceae bacterium]
MVGAARTLARRTLAGAAVFAATIGLATAAERLSVVGACRDGVPNGAYELRMPDGRLRVAGAFALGRKTGTFIFWTASGARSVVVPYDDDRKSGTVARWYTTASGRESGRRLEAPFNDNVLHGVERSWHANGVPRTESRYEHGALVATQAWDRRGTPLPEAEARRQAAQDAAAEERFLSELEATIQGNLPRCDNGTAF